MNEDLGRLQVRIEANDARFRQGMARTRREFDRSATSIEARARALDTRLSSVGGRFGSRQARAQFVNFGQQLQDVAVQAEAGTDAIRIFSQQGPQILSIFGPVGVTLGIVAAVGGAVASAFLGVSDATKDAADEMETFSDIANAADSGLSDLVSAAKAYDSAIRATAAGQTAATDSIVADTKREFEAKKELLKLEQRRLQALNAVRQGEIQANRERLDRISAGRRRAVEVRGEEAVLEELAGNVPGVDLSGEIKEVQNLTTEITRLRAEGELADVALGKLGEALNLEFTDLAGGAGAALTGDFGTSGRSRSRGSAGRSGRQEDGFIEIGRKRIEALTEERRAVELSGVELDRYQARLSASRLEQELMTRAAEESGGKVLPQQAQAIQQIKQAYLDLSDGIIIAREAGRQFDEAQKEAQQAAQQTAQAQQQVFDRIGDSFASAIEQADSFTDALKRIGIELAQLAIKDLFKGSGSSILGAFGLSDIFGSVVASANGNAFAGGKVIPFASGGVVSNPTLFPMKNATGLMGEAGPEAIMPLSRGPDGKLGVRSAGGGANVTVHNHYNGVNGQTRAMIEQATAQSEARMTRQVADLASAGFRAKPGRRK